MTNQALYRPDCGPDLEAQARSEAERLVRQHPPAFLDALIRALQEQVPRRRGRPQGSGEDDVPLLKRMEELLRSGEAKSQREAARLVARLHPGHSETATLHRLRRKYSKERGALNEEAAASPNVGDELESYFREDVEMWDL